ncbi:MAG: hypothetical protein AAB654_12755 [Acidobacteriota bacterium]
MKSHLLTVFVLGMAVLIAGLGTRAAREPEGSPDPATMRIEYRPGAYFPEGFPLHGTVRVLTNPVVEMGRRTRIHVEYTVGDMPIETGTSLEIWKHFTSDVEEFQVTDPNAPAWFSVQFTDPSVRGETKKYTNWVQRNSPSVFPYRKAASVTITQGGLRQGGKVIFDLGGPQGVRMQHYQENLFNFRLAIAKNEKLLGYGGDALLSVTGGPMRRLKVQAPSIVALGERFPVEIVPQDEWGSLAKNHRALAFRVTSGAVEAGDFQYEPKLMHYVARDAIAASEGALRIGVETANGEVKGVSNPIWVQRHPVRRVYYGDLHQHTYLADGRGVFEELYLYARRVGLLDFGAVTPHHMPMSVTGPQLLLDGKKYAKENWPELMRVTKLMNGWEGLVSILGYEYSVGTNVGGHHNVFYNADQAKTTMQLDPNDPMAPVAKMLKTLQLAKVPTLVIPHIGGGPPDWSHPTDPRIERLFEITSVHGVFEESFQKHLATGLRVGASASGDTHTVAMGNAYPGLVYVMSNGLTGVYANGKTRNDIWQGLYERRTFAVTNAARILMDFSVNGEPMGGDLPLGNTKEAGIAARVSGTAPLLRVEVLKNNKVIHSASPSRNRGHVLRVIWGDNLYQRRAATGLRSGELRPERGRLRLARPINLDQAFEHVEQAGDRITWTTAAVSNDRDGFLADISEADGDLLFRLDDSDTMGLFEVRVPLAQLRRDGYFSWSKPGAVSHPYMEKMGVKPAFFLECELVNPEGPADFDLNYQDRGPLKSGDYYYLRMEQLDTNKAWSSPVWID